MKRLPRTLRLSRQAFAADPGREMEAGDPGAVEGKAVALWRIAPADPRAERQSPDATAARSGSAGAYHPGQSRRFGHPAASVSSFTLSCFEDFEGRPNPNNKRRARRERRKARTELRLVAQHEVENNVEVAFCDPSERRLQVLIVNLQRLMQLGLRPHVASSGHLDEGIQSDVKDWHVRTVL
jgi:hypothetical protein